MYMMSTIFKKIKILILGIFLVPVMSIVVVSCKKQNYQGVPNVAVDIRMYSSDPSFINLNAIGGWVYVNGGNRGIVVYRKDLSNFMAYDRTCSYNPPNVNETVKVDPTNNIMLIDPNCGSKFLITDGSVNQGPATYPLKAYQTTYDGTVLHIFN